MPYAPKLKESASQTAGPYVHIGCVPTFAGLEGMYGGNDLGKTMITGAAQGEKITIEGIVYDGGGNPLKDAMLEIWQADTNGVYNSPEDGRPCDPHFTGWGRQPADGETGEYRFETIKPGTTLFRDGKTPQAPHIHVWVVARGINLGLNTRIYFEDEAEANAKDPVLSRIEAQNRVQTLIAKKSGSTYRFDIYLQGDNETVFFDV